MIKRTGIFILVFNMLMYSSYAQTTRTSISCELAKKLTTGVDINQVKQLTGYVPLQIGKSYHWEKSGNVFDLFIYTNGAYEYYGPIPALLNTAISSKSLSYLKAQQVLGIPQDKGYIYQLTFRDNSYIRLNINQDGKITVLMNSFNCNQPR